MHYLHPKECSELEVGTGKTRCVEIKWRAGVRAEKGLEGEKCFRISVMKLFELVPAYPSQALLPHLLCTKAVAPQACNCSFERLVGGSRT